MKSDAIALTVESKSGTIATLRRFLVALHLASFACPTSNHTAMLEIEDKERKRTKRTLCMSLNVCYLIFWA